MGSSCSLWNILNQMGEGEGEGPVWKWKKNQDVDDDDLHFMQRALLKWRREASPPTLHRHIVIIIIISVTTTTKCFCESSERWELRSFKPCRNFTSFHFLMNAKTFALLTRRASSSSSAWCSVRLEGRPFLFRLLQLPHLYVRYVVFSGWEPLWVFVADTGDWRKEDGRVSVLCADRTASCDGGQLGDRVTVRLRGSEQRAGLCGRCRWCPRELHIPAF